MAPFVAAVQTPHEQHHQDLDVDLEQVRRVQQGGVGDMTTAAELTWRNGGAGKRDLDLKIARVLRKTCYWQM